jgi:voltage-gated potassium channel
MLKAAPDRRAWVRSHPLEVAIVVLTLPFGPTAIQSARALRLLRLLRLLRFAKLARGVFTLDGLKWIAVLTGLLLVAGGAAFSVAERGHHQPSVSTWDGIWWGVVTLTTVGYGDITPVTAAGRTIATVLSIVGIGFVAMLTAAAAERFARRDIEREPLAIQQEILAELRGISDRLERLENDGTAERSPD